MTDLMNSSVKRVAGFMRYRFDEESGSLRGRLKGLSIWIGGDKHNVRLLGHSIPPKKSGSATNSHQPQPSNSGAPDVAGSSSEHPGRADDSKPKVTFKATVDVAIIENDKDGLRRDEDGNLVEGNPALREEGPLSKKSKFEFGEPGQPTYKKINLYKQYVRNSFNESNPSREIPKDDIEPEAIKTARGLVNDNLEVNTTFFRYFK